MGELSKLLLFIRFNLITSTRQGLPEEVTSMDPLGIRTLDFKTIDATKEKELPDQRCVSLSNQLVKTGTAFARDVGKSEEVILPVIVSCNRSQRPASCELSNKTSTETPENSTHGQRTVQTRPSANWLTRICEYFFPDKDVQVRQAKTTSAPLVYHHFRQVDCGANGLVDLAYQSPDNSKNVSDNPLDVEQYFEGERERPEKVPGIRKAARQNSTEVNNSAGLLARKTYVSSAVSPMEDT
ncbi:hypothetical protein J7438_10330 [Thalassotalea sp. G20_0]|uniref:hypothetical protein n=1 Tax=Thalassotalea sp. G20_0 TaxID=2821093 RepID=UPI001ADA5831|nr:hypothetical protein [Thalassotalea sp. G20_0]MBO9494481.1 hypothetical protein [Thalassotalea sp. G20_0]